MYTAYIHTYADIGIFKYDLLLVTSTLCCNQNIPKIQVDRCLLLLNLPKVPIVLRMKFNYFSWYSHRFAFQSPLFLPSPWDLMLQPSCSYPTGMLSNLPHLPTPNQYSSFRFRMNDTLESQSVLRPHVSVRCPSLVSLNRPYFPYDSPCPLFCNSFFNVIFPSELHTGKDFVFLIQHILQQKYTPYVFIQWMNDFKNALLTNSTKERFNEIKQEWQ